MKNIFFLLIIISFSTTCSPKIVESIQSKPIKIAFGSCNDQELMGQNLWKELLTEKPNYFIWLGDIVYPKENNLESIQEGFFKLKNQLEYKKFEKSTTVIGTWDDHDYGMNDGGFENELKDSVKTILLDFLAIPKKSPLTKHNGMYTSYQVAEGNVKIIVLDTRYFRSELTKSSDPTKRYTPNAYGNGTMLGEEQWKWLERELRDSDAQIHIVVSSIQVLNHFHGYEKWGNMPHERERLLNLLNQGKKQTILVSGDRHFSEISKAGNLVEITSSGLNKVYSNHEEKNPLRISKFINKPSYGLIEIIPKKQYISIKMKGRKGIVYDSFQKRY